VQNQEVGVSDSLRGKVAIVTGGSRGIGRAIAGALAAAGADVAIAARDADVVESAAAELSRDSPARVMGVRCDVRLQHDCEALVHRTARELGGIDILINNAGVGRFASVTDLEPDDWRAVIETNLNGVFYCTPAALPHLAARGASWFSNIGRLAG
jgi:NAD(P)-dependent dehydrogenase (short-subunit alcohol dehydrogenase family)